MNKEQIILRMREIAEEIIKEGADVAKPAIRERVPYSSTVADFVKRSVCFETQLA